MRLFLRSTVFTSVWLLAVLVWGGCSDASFSKGELDPSDVYEHRPSEDSAGTGKFYMGREISRVMGHVGVDWLERPSREAQELPERLVNVLDLKPTDVVADIGAGTGYLTFRISPRVPFGKVLAVDIQQEMLDLIRQRIDSMQVTNVEPVKGTITDPNLPTESVDLALMVDSYHEFSHPYEMMTNIVEALRPGGRVVLVEYRGEDPTLPIRPLHRMTEEQARKEMEAVGLVHRETKNVLPQQHVMIFEKPFTNVGEG